VHEYINPTLTDSSGKTNRENAFMWHSANQNAIAASRGSSAAPSPVFDESGTEFEPGGVADEPVAMVADMSKGRRIRKADGNIPASLIPLALPLPRSTTWGGISRNFR